MLVFYGVLGRNKGDMESELRKDPALLPSRSHDKKAAYDKGLCRCLHASAAGHTRYKEFSRNRSGNWGEIQDLIPDTLQPLTT